MTARRPERLHLEDFAPGQVYELGEVAVSEREIIDFADRFDPQPFHTDPEQAARTHFGGLIASGWHTVALYMRLYVDGLLARTAGLGSPGVEEVRWLKPVRPGDVLRGRATVLTVEPSARHPERGTVRMRSELIDADGAVVMRMIGRGLVARRHHPAGDAR